MVKTRTVILSSDGSGDAVATLSANGIIRQLLIVNDSVATPTTLWDLTIADLNGTQVYQNLNVSIAGNTVAIPTLAGTAGNTEYPYTVAGTITFTGANMGASKIATVVLYLE